MNRRKFLSVTGCTIFTSVVGCIETGEKTDRLGERIDEKSASFTVQDLTVQQSIAYRGSVHYRVRNDADHQYLIFGVDIHSDVNNSKIYDRFTISINGKVREEVGVPRISTKNQSELERDMYLIYDVSRELSLANNHLKFSGLNRDYKFSISDAIESEGLSTYIQNPPNPQVESFNVPDSITADQDSAEVEVTISEDDREKIDVKEPMKLLIGSTKTSGSSVYTATVRGGETNVHDFRVPIYPNQGSDVETIRLRWGQSSLSKDIPIQK